VCVLIPMDQPNCHYQNGRKPLGLCSSSRIYKSVVQWPRMSEDFPKARNHIGRMSPTDNLEGHVKKFFLKRSQVDELRIREELSVHNENFTKWRKG